MPGHGRTQPRSPLFLPVASVVLIWVLFGGAAPTGIVPFAMLALSGSALLALLALHGKADLWLALSWPARALVVFVCAVPLAQLIPLPPDLWQALPGRDLAVATLEAVGQADRWHPATLAVGPTFRSLLVHVWLAALLLAVVQLPTRDLRRIFGLVLVLGLLNVAIGIVQVVSNNTLLVFHKGFEGRFLTGLFANKNHTGLFIAMTFLFGYGALYARHGWDKRNLAFVVSISLVLVIALLATFSRAGIVFGLAALAFLVVLSSSERLGRNNRYVLIAVPVVAAVLFAVLAMSDLATRAIARFGDMEADMRWSIWDWSWPLVGGYFPVGSGVGSFTAVFPPHEQLEWLQPSYINHVHNDYLEQLIESGIAAPVCWALLVAAVWRPLVTAWAARDSQSGRLALLGAMALFFIAAHSVIDYPLRRPAIPAVAMIALGALLRVEVPNRPGRPTHGYRARLPGTATGGVKIGKRAWINADDGSTPVSAF